MAMAAHGTHLQTGIAPLRWSYLKSGKRVVENAQLTPLATHGSWFDELFLGGIFLPPSDNRALTLLITGPPGTGKSTLATEICVRLARGGYHQFKHKRALYVASEAYPPWVVNNVKSFGWPDRVFNVGDANPNSDSAEIYVRTLEDISRYKPDKTIVGTIRDFFDFPDDSDGHPAPTFITDVGLVIIDSLNCIKQDKAGEFEKHRGAFVNSGPQLIIMVMDSPPKLVVSEPWEFAADTVIRLDKEYRSGSKYMVRTLEILKARYQEHVWGRHQLKIYGKPLDDSAHPFSPEGGIFVFPSLHFILSKLKLGGTERSSSSGSAPPMQTRLDGMNTLLRGGLPVGRSTALVGNRGAHKSHLGLLQALQNLMTQNGHSLVISLRDDNIFTLQTLRDQLRDHWGVPNPQEQISDFILSGRLEIAYYTPGYITPEEFFHRMLLSLYRMKHSGGPVLLLFNSLDQLSSRFPLCAEEKVFVPAILQTLASLDVTSIFVGAGREDQDEGIRNLLSMAELILGFSRRTFKSDELKGVLLENRHMCIPNAQVDSLNSIAGFETTVLTVERYAGGHSAGAEGLLELVDRNSVFNKVLVPGLHLLPIPQDYKHNVAMSAAR
jgi:KaiC/GvpD/RAD55 family RecA-like ATPase